MTLHEIFPSPIKGSGIKALLSDEYMLACFKKFRDAVVSQISYFKRAKNRIHEDSAFLKVFFFSEMSGRSIHETSEALNEYLKRCRRGKVKSFSDGRKRRMIPHQTSVNKFLRKISLEKARKILRECLDAQLNEALEHGLISRKVNVLIDLTEHPYYGKREDALIKGTTRQKGTRKMRHYLVFSILSRGVHLFAGLEQVAKGESKIPVIIKFLSYLLELGFELNHVLMDREFYRVALIKAIKDMKGRVIIPAKNYRKIRAAIESYLKGKKKRVSIHVISTALGGKNQQSQVVYLMINAKRGHSLREVKRAFLSGEITLEEARSKTFALLTTERPKSNTSSWASKKRMIYRKRWQIETAFSDLNRINRYCKSSSDGVHYIDMLARMLLYNSWKLNQKYLSSSSKKSFRKINWTLRKNNDCLVGSFLSIEKKSLGVV